MDIPKKIAKRFESLKNNDPHLYLKSFSSRFYVYKVLQSQSEKKRTITSYIGRITEDGAFIKKGMEKKEKKLEMARAIIEGSGGKVIMPEIKFEDGSQREKELLTPSEEEAKILTILSMNGRAKMKSIARLLGITQQSATRRVKALERKYAIKYIMEVDPTKLGFLEYMVFLKFEGEKPSVAEIKHAFEDQPMVQLCALLKGEYDLMLYILVDNLEVDESLIKLVYMAFRTYTLKWYIKSGSTMYGLIPIRDTFFNLLKNKVWQGKKETKLQSNVLLHREYVVMRTLNSKGSKSFKNIDNENNLINGSARYSYYKMVADKLIKRITICECSLPIAYSGIIQYQTINASKFDESRTKYRLDLIKSTSMPYNTYSLIFDIFDPEGFLAIQPFTKDESIDARLDELKAQIKGVELHTIVITNVLIGNLCFRKYDNMSSVQYANLVKSKVIEQGRLTNYAQF